MAKVIHTCTGCVPIDASIVEVYTRLIATEARAEAAAEHAEQASAGKAPYIGENGNWWEWDSELNAFVDTGVQASTGMEVDDQMSDTSTNPVQNRVVKEYIDEHTASDPDSVKFTEQSLTDLQKSQARSNIGAGTYSKASSGVPKTDLASAVQTSLEKADTAYQKPIGGIPASDLASGVIPTVPTDVVKYSSQSLTDAQKTQARTNIGAAAASALTTLETAIAAKYTKPSSGIPETDLAANVQSALALARTSIQSLADYYDKTEIDSLLAAVNSQEYVDVATLPTASASTLGKIYLVGPTNNQYDRYYTSYNGSAYSWVAAGSTEINLSNYATKAELNQLEGKLAQLFINVAENGLYFVDVNYNIGAYIDGTGMHTINQLEYIKIQ